MNNKSKCFYFLPIQFFCIACNNNSDQEPTATDFSIKTIYGFDAAFLKKHTRKVIEPGNKDGIGKILLSADYQGRVVTSTAEEDNPTSYGLINYDLVASREKNKQFNVVGSEERFWMGPEGGQ